MRFLRIDSSVDSGSGEPCCGIAPAPAAASSHSIAAPVASTARTAPATTSGPIPSPRINVTRVAIAGYITATMTTGLAGKPIVVTGGHGALGGAVVEALSAAGATCHAPSQHELELTDETAVVAYYARLPPIWASVHVAGGYAGAPFVDTSLADLRRQIDMNLATCFLCCREAVKSMTRASSGGATAGGRIINVGSRAALDPRGRRDRLQPVEGGGGFSDPVPRRRGQGIPDPRERRDPVDDRHARPTVRRCLAPVTTAGPSRQKLRAQLPGWRARTTSWFLARYFPSTGRVEQSQLGQGLGLRASVSDPVHPIQIRARPSSPFSVGDVPAEAANKHIELQFSDNCGRILRPMGIAGLVVGTYLVILLALAFYGFHRSSLVFLYYRNRHKAPRPIGTFSDLPAVTVQLPLFNEMYVVERLLDAVAEIRHPRDRFQIQVLDDSTDETQEICKRKIAELRARYPDLDIEYVHRVDRSGFKAGALENGLRTAKGEFILIFDADFLPQRRRARAQHPPLPRPEGRRRAVPLGPPQPRLLGAHRGAGADARRPLHHGARGPQPLRPLLQLQRHRRHLAARRRSPTRAAGSTTR